MTTQAPVPSGGDTIQGSRAINFAFKCINRIEVWGNKLPHPFWLFVVLSGVLVGLSAILDAIGVAATKPDDGSVVAVKSLISREGMTVIVGDVVENFASFPPLATILTTMLGIVIAEKRGCLTLSLRSLLRKFRLALPPLRSAMQE